MKSGHALGLSLILITGSSSLVAESLQDPANPAEPANAAVDQQGALPAAVVAPDRAPAEDRPAEALAQPVNPNQNLKPMAEGPLHEAFLSPRKDLTPIHVAKGPQPPIDERPGVDPPSANAQWIEGYWNWDPGRNDYVWVTGTWRVPPPGRLWVNGYWKRDEQGWYRVPGFWSDRKTDRLDYRKEGPPKERPDDDPGDPPAPDCFYVPGQYYPDGNGVIWKKGFWAKAQDGWSWVPVQWIRQPEGWVFQEGYWDRTLEDRGTLFAPAEVDKSAKPSEQLA